MLFPLASFNFHGFDEFLCTCKCACCMHCPYVYTYHRTCCRDAGPWFEGGAIRRRHGNEIQTPRLQDGSIRPHPPSKQNWRYDNKANQHQHPSSKPSSYFSPPPPPPPPPPSTHTHISSSSKDQQSTPLILAHTHTLHACTCIVVRVLTTFPV